MTACSKYYVEYFIKLWFTSRINMTTTEPDFIQCPLTVGLFTLTAAFLSFLGVLFYMLTVHNKSPATHLHLTRARLSDPLDSEPLPGS